MYVVVHPAERMQMFDLHGFPLADCDNPGSAVPKVSAGDAMPDRSALRVVVVDDNYDANAALSRLLEKSGFDVVGRAYDGLAGLSLIKNVNPDVAILDIAMPALDGLDLARRIHAEISSPPRLVCLTGFGEESNQAEATSAGFDAYFRKPADWPVLQSLLRYYAT